MMATSQNGWPVYTSGSHPDLVAIPKIIGRVRKGDVATIFTYLVTRFDREVEDVDAGADDWGYAYRAIRGKTSGYSNHASATAIDLNATRHPLGKVGTFSATQRAAIRRILNDLEGVVRWGGDYSGRKDEMHFEINAGAAAVARVAAKIRRGSLVSRPAGGGGGPATVPNVPSAPAPLIPEDFLMTLSHDEQKKLASQVNAIYQALFYGSRANRRDYPGLLDMVVENQVRIGRVPGQVWDTKVKRSAGPVSALQDLANGTTHAAEAVAQTAGLRELIGQLAEGRDVDLDAIEERMRDVLKTGVVKVEISVPDTTPQPAPDDVVDVDAIAKED